MKTKSTKRALLASLLSLVICISMLVGSTFAWFTDSVTSANNIIQSGNLDVELYYQAEGQTDWTKVTNTTNVFKENALWEPGHTEVVKLKVVNEGSLALKYTLGVNVASEVGSTNVNGEPFKLSDFIKYGIVDGAQDYTRETAIAAVDTTATALKTAYNSAVTALDAKNDGNTDEKIVTMVVYMPTTVGNEANHNGTAPVINLGINLFATQMTAESDSFNNQYDKDAWHPDFVVTNSDELKVALTNGGNVALANNIIISESLPVTKDTVLDLNGKNIGTSGSTTGSPLYLQGGKLTVKNGTLDLDGSQTNVNGTFSTAIGYDAQTELVVENVNFTGKTAINGTFATDGPLKIAISDCTMDVTSVGIAVSANSTEAIATINNCNIDADEYAIFASQGSKITINGGTYKSAGKVITSMYDNTVVTINGGTFDGELWVTNGGSLVIKGGTFTADPTAYVADGYDAVTLADGSYVVINRKAAEVKVLGLTLVPNGDNSKIIVNDKEGFLNLTKLFANWTALFTDGNGNEWSNYANGAGVDYYYGGRWTISLEADIDLNNATIAPVTIKHPVRAGDPTFDGNNHTIKNAKIVADAAAENMTGLFNVSNEAFKNLKLDNIHVTGSNVGNSNAGILAGYCSGRIDNITITNSSVTGGKYTGGVVGSGYTDISNCTLTNVTVKGGYKLGGIIGYICAETGYTHNVTGNTLTDCTVDGIGGGVFAGGKSEYIIGKIVGNYNCNGTCNNNTITNMSTSASANIGKIEAGMTVTQ